MTESEKSNNRIEKLRGDSAQEYQDWKEEAEAYIQGLPENVPKKAHGRGAPPRSLLCARQPAHA